MGLLLLPFAGLLLLCPTAAQPGPLTSPSEAPEQIADALDLHRDALVVDGHVHMVNAVVHQGIDPWKVQSTGTFDYARARQGGLDVAIEHLYIEDSYNHYNYTVKQACRLIEAFYRVLEANRERMELALNSQDVRRIVLTERWQWFWPWKVGSTWRGTWTCFDCSTAWVCAWSSS